MALTTAVSVTTTATPLSAVNAGRNSIVIANNGAATLFIGDASVTTATGLPIANGSPFSDEGQDHFRGAIYGICASGTLDVRVWES